MPEKTWGKARRVTGGPFKPDFGLGQFDARTESSRCSLATFTFSA